MRAKQKLWVFKKKTQAFLISNELKNNGRIIKGAILSILAGFIVAGIIVAAQNVNPFEYYFQLFKVAFHPIYLSQTLQWFSVYVIAGLAMAVGFKTGIFNIGVSGQMLGGAAMGTVIFNLISPGAQSVPGWMVFVIFITCILVGSLLAGFAGWLKAMFNIHEVVSTIMLNWIIWYLFKFVFLKWKADFTPNGPATNPFPAGTLNWGSNEIVGPILIAAVAVVIVWVIFAKTVFGFRLKAVGSSTTVSKYAGINVKNKIITSMAISGALAGLASFVNIFTVSPNLAFGIDNLPTVGYDAIAVSLVAFNNPFGVIAVSMLWGTVQSAGGSAAALFNMPSQLNLLIFGVIVYFAAISIVFIKWAPGYTLKLRYYIWNSKLYSNKTKELTRAVLQYRWWMHEPSRNPEYSKQMNNFKQRIKVAQSDLEIKEIKTEMKDYKFDFKENCRLNFNKYDTQLKNLKTNIYLKEIERGLSGIKTRSHQRINKINEHGLDKINLFDLELVKKNTQLTDAVNEITNAHQKATQDLKDQFEKNKNALEVWKEGQLGYLKLDFELSNSKVAFKGEYSKQKNILLDEIKSVHSQQRTQFHLLKFNDEITSVERQSKRQEVRQETKVKIRQIKSKIKADKITLNQRIKSVKEKHAQRAAELLKNPAKIEAIEAEYKNRLEQINEQYAQDLIKIDEVELKRVQGIDLPKAHAELAKGKTILAEGIEKIVALDLQEKASFEKQTKNLSIQLDLIKAMFDQLHKLFGRKILRTYDDNETMEQKLAIFAQLWKLEHLYQVQLTIVETDEKLIKAKKQNKLVLNNYKKNLGNFKAEYKEKLKAIKEQPKDETYSQSVIENEQVYFNKVNDYINDLEQKYVVKGVN